jgi:hypothetical protein
MSQHTTSTTGSSRKEGLYEHEEGKVLEYKDRVTDQEEIKIFVNMVFESTSLPGKTNG